MEMQVFGRRFLWKNILWYTPAALAAIALFTSIPIYLSQLGQLTPIEQIQISFTSPNYQPDGSFEYWLDLANMVIQLISSISCIGLAVLISRQRPNDRMAQVVFVFLILFGTFLSGPLQTLSQSNSTLFPIVARAEAILFTGWAVLFYIFPDGQFFPAWTRRFAVAFLPWCLITLVFRDFFSPLAKPEAWQIFVIFVWYMIWPMTSLASQFLRYRRHSSRLERQQTKWVIFGFLLFVAAMFAMYFFIQVLAVFPADQALAASLSFLSRSFGLAWYLLVSLVPLTMGVAVLRYHLWDIDFIINRTLVYGALTALVLGTYILIVGGINVLFNSGGNFLLSLLATGLVIVIVLPLRDRLQRTVNRMMYGERDDPYAVLSRLGQQLKETFIPESVLPNIVETIAQTLKLPYVAISLKQGTEYKIEAEFGLNPGKSKIGTKMEVFPLVYQSEIIGELILAPRSQSETFTPAEKKLLAGVADQAALAAYTVRLMSDLKESRQRLITAREEERRHLRRELHDGLGSILASLSFNLDAAYNLLGQNPAATGSLLKELKGQTQAAINDVRRLAYDLRPPVLDELGLAASLQAYVKGLNCPPDLRIKFEIPDPLPALPAAVEAATYRISIEAINNAVRHSGACNCVVAIAPGAIKRLEVEITDDGNGLPTPWHTGVGILAMRERAAELGGTFMIESNPGHGTQIAVTLPLSRG